MSFRGLRPSFELLSWGLNFSWGTPCLSGLFESLSMNITFKRINNDLYISSFFLDYLLTCWWNSDVNQVELSSSADLVLPLRREIRNFDVLISETLVLVEIVSKFLSFSSLCPSLNFMWESISLLSFCSFLVKYLTLCLPFRTFKSIDFSFNGLNSLLKNWEVLVIIMKTIMNFVNVLVKMLTRIFNMSTNSLSWSRLWESFNMSTECLSFGSSSPGFTGGMSTLESTISCSCIEISFSLSILSFNNSLTFLTNFNSKHVHVLFLLSIDLNLWWESTFDFSRDIKKITMFKSFFGDVFNLSTECLSSTWFFPMMSSLFESFGLLRSSGFF